ncbi:hypothetical protein MMPV_000470 [Pyropia vietnamensis]
MDPEEAAVERALTRLAVASSDAALQSVLGTLLPALLAATATTSPGAKRALIDALQHINVRLRAAATVRLPTAALLRQAADPSTPPVARTFLLSGGYLRRAVSREDAASRAALLREVIAAAESGVPPSRASAAVLASLGNGGDGSGGGGASDAAAVVAAHSDLEALAAVLLPQPDAPAPSASAALAAAAAAATGTTTVADDADAGREESLSTIPPWPEPLPAGPPAADVAAARSRATILAVAADCLAAADSLPASSRAVGGREVARDARYEALLRGPDALSDAALSVWVAYLGAVLAGRLPSTVAPSSAVLAPAIRFLEAYARHARGGADTPPVAKEEEVGAHPSAEVAAGSAAQADGSISGRETGPLPGAASGTDGVDGGDTPSWAAARVYPLLLRGVADGSSRVAEAAEAALRRLPTGGKTADAHPGWLPTLLLRAAGSPGASVALRAAALSRALVRSTAAAGIFPGAIAVARASAFCRGSGPAAGRLRGLGIQWIGWMVTHASDAAIAQHGSSLVGSLSRVLSHPGAWSSGLCVFAPSGIASLAIRCPALVADGPSTARVVLAAAADKHAPEEVRASAARALDGLSAAYAVAAPGVREVVAAAGVEAFHSDAMSPAGRAACMRWVASLGGEGVEPRWLAVVAAGDEAAEVRAAAAASLRTGALPPSEALLDAAAAGGSVSALPTASVPQTAAASSSSVENTYGADGVSDGGVTKSGVSHSPGGPRLTPESWAALLGFALRCWAAEQSGSPQPPVAEVGTSTNGVAKEPPLSRPTARLLKYATALLLPTAAPAYVLSSRAAVPPVPTAVTAAPALTVVLTLAGGHPTAVAKALHPHLRTLTAAAAAVPPPSPTVMAALARVVGVAVTAAPAEGMAETVAALTSEVRVAASAAASTGGAGLVGKVDAAVLCLGRVLAAVGARADVPRDDAFESLVEVLMKEGASVGAAATAIGAVGECGRLPLAAGSSADEPSTKPTKGSPSTSEAKRLKTDAPPVTTRAGVVARLADLAADMKDSARVVEAAASALGKLAVGDRSLAPAVVTALQVAASARPEEEVAMSVAEALTRAATGLNLPPPPLADEEDDVAAPAPMSGAAAAGTGESAGAGGDANGRPERAARVVAATAEEELAAVVAAPDATLVWVGGEEPSVAPAGDAKMDVNADGDGDASAGKAPNAKDPLIKTTLDAMLGLCYNPVPHIRAAGVVGVYTALKLIGSPTAAPTYTVGDDAAGTALAAARDAVRDVLPGAQRAFATLLADQNPVTQQLAARGVVLAHHLSDPAAQADLVASLVKSLASDRSKASTASTVPGDEASLLPGAAPGGAAVGGSSVGGSGGGAAPSTYRDLCAVATDAGHPELLYKLMDVAGAAAMWNSRRGAALASRALLRAGGGGGDGGTAAQLAPHLPVLLPRVFLYAHDPAASVASSMKSVLDALAKAGGYSSDREAVDAHYDAVLGHTLTAMGARLWRLREAACGAARSALGGRSWAAVSPHMALMWRMLWRAMDDVKETVRIAAGAYGRTLGELSVRLCDARLSSTSTAGAAVGVVLPALLPALTHSVAEVRQLAWKTLSTVLRTAGSGAAGSAALQPVVPSAAGALLEAATELEPAALNYAQFHVADGDSLEAARVSAAASSASDVIDALERLVPLVTDANAKELVGVVVRSAKTGVGVPTRVATARFIRSLTAAAGGATAAVAPSAGRLLRAAAAAASAERSSSMLSAWASAAGSAARIATDTAVGRFAGELAADAATEDAMIRMRTAILARGFYSQAPDVAARHAAVLLPVAYIGSHADDSAGGDAWRTVWADGCPSPAAGLRLYYAEVATMAAAQLADSPSYDVKRAAAGALGGLAAPLVGRAGTERVVADALAALVAALPGRLWEGKSALVTAVAELVEALAGVQDPPRDVTVAATQAPSVPTAARSSSSAAAAPGGGSSGVLARTEKQREDAAWADAVWAALPAGAAGVAAAVLKEATRGPAAYRSTATTALGRVVASVRDRVALVDDVVTALSPLLASAAPTASATTPTATAGAAADADLAAVQGARRDARAATVRALGVVAAAYPSAAAPTAWQAAALPTVVALLAGGVAGEREVRLAATTALGAVARRSDAGVLAAAAPALLSGPPPTVPTVASPPAAGAGRDPAPPPSFPPAATASLGAALADAVADARFATVRRAALEVVVWLRGVVPAEVLGPALATVAAPGGGNLLNLLRSVAAADRDAAAKELGGRAVAGL